MKTTIKYEAMTTMKNSIETIFNDTYKEISSNMNKYLDTDIIVIFKNKTYFICKPFDCFDEYMEIYYDNFKQNEIEDIIIKDTQYTNNEYTTTIFTTITENNVDTNTFKKFTTDLEKFVYEYYNQKMGYKDINDIIYENEEWLWN